MRVVENQFVRLTLGDDGVIETVPLGTQRNSDILSEIAGAIAEVGGGSPRPMLWDPAGTLPLPPQGWQVIINNIESVVSALAVVVDEAEAPLLGSFPGIIDTLLLPVRIFHSKPEARAWLQGHVDPELTTD